MIVNGVCQSPSGLVVSVSGDGSIRRWQPSSSSGISGDLCCPSQLIYEYDEFGVSDEIAGAHNGQPGMFCYDWNLCEL